jgi:uncharacterized protein YciI
MPHLFVLDLRYTADLAQVDALLPANRDWLAQHYTAGTFLASGRKEPRTGGIVLAQGERSAIDAILAEDPLTIGGVVAYTVTEFVPTTTGPALEHLRVDA